MVACSVSFLFGFIAAFYDMLACLLFLLPTFEFRFPPSTRHLLVGRVRTKGVLFFLYVVLNATEAECRVLSQVNIFARMDAVVVDKHCVVDLPTVAN